MIILGIESTAHTFGVGIVDDKGKVVANKLDSYTSDSIGMIPNKIAEHHQAVAAKILEKALQSAKMKMKDVDMIAYSAGPGLDPALWTGYNFAKDLAVTYKKKLIGVNHCCAHLSIGKMLHKLQDPCYLYVSGVNTQIIAYEGGKYRFILLMRGGRISPAISPRPKCHSRSTLLESDKSRGVD